MPASPRQNTKLESEGAEFIVLGTLLIEGISCYKAYANFPGYDLVAVNTGTSRTARIQVKSRWATNYDRSFSIKNFDCEFVVHVALNRGYRFGKRATEANPGIEAPNFFVFPVDVVRQAQSGATNWSKVRLAAIPDHQMYRERWDLISEYLNG